MPMRQYGHSFIVNSNYSSPLQLTKQSFDENWLQQFIFDNPQVLPVHEIEPTFGSLIPICRELRTNAGPIDLVFANDLGLLTLVECKLWKNPESRREVVGQILDYAKEISRWNYSELDVAIKRSGASALELDSRGSLFDKVSSQSEDLDESEFIDNVSRNLKRGRFLLLIVGNGIRESVESIAEFLQEHAHLNFSFSLVELGGCQIPTEVGGGHLVQPRVIAQTVEIERAVIRIEGGQWSIEKDINQKEEVATGKRRTKISEQQFFDDVALTSHQKEELRKFFDRSLAIGLFIKPGDNSLMLKYNLADIEYTFGVFRKNGSFQNFGIALVTSGIGHPEIGENYLEGLSVLLKDTYVYKDTNKFQWTVKKKNGQPVPIAECLGVTDKWLQLIEKTVDELNKIQENLA